MKPNCSIGKNLIGFTLIWWKSTIHIPYLVTLDWREDVELIKLLFFRLEVNYSGNLV